MQKIPLESKTKNKWNLFLLKNGPRSGLFLNSWQWGEFQSKVGNTVDQYIFEKNGVWRGISNIVHKKLKLFGDYCYVPRGPVCVRFSYVKEILDLIIKDNWFVRFDHSFTNKLKFPGFYKTTHVQPSKTIITNLSKTEDELMASMHKKTRYNIRLAKKNGVHVNLSSVDFELVWDVFEETSKRDGFGLHKKDYYKKMVSELNSEECNVFLATATFEDQVLAANIMIDFGGTRTYLHGASSNLNRNLMAPYLLHWYLIKDAKYKGIDWYDWWGVCDKNDKNHQWAGITRFKLGFGGEDVEYAGTYDYTHKPVQYLMYRHIRYIKNLIKK